MPWSAFPFVRIIFSLIIGILLCTYFHLYSFYFLVIITCLSIAYILFYFLLNPEKRRKFDFVFGLIAALLFVCLGIALTTNKTEIIKPNHFANLSDSIMYYEGLVNEAVQEKTKTYNTEIKVIRIFSGGKWQEAEGFILLYIKKIDNKNLILKYGDKIVIKGQPQPTLPPLNPQAFNFRQYLAYQQIYHQHFISPHQLEVIGNEVPNVIYNLALKLRKKADSSLRKFIKGEQEYAIVTALVLGVKDYLDNEIRSAYSNTGAMHVLAVSGLHVGILFKILEWLLGWIKRKQSYGKWLFLGVVLVVLWFYAFITGLSASVLRAVIMFSMVAIASVIQRNSNIYNTIAFSALLILGYDPYLLFSVSFQLSYLAVLGIIYFFQKIYDLIRLEDIFPTMPLWLFKILNFVWSITCVSIAAQLGTFPVGLYYFHQFPVYFMLSNLVVIPLATFLFSGGLVIIFLDFIPIPVLSYVNEWVGIFTEYLVFAQNWLLFSIDHFPFSVINGISISLWETLTIYLTILLICLLFIFRKLSYLITVFVLVGVFGTWQVIEFVQQQQQESIYIFHTNKNLNINLLAGNHNVLIADSSLLYDDLKIRNQFYNYWAYKGVTPTQVTYANMDNLAAFENQKVALQRGISFYLLAYKGKQILWLSQKTNQKSLPSADYLVISNNAVRNLQQVKAENYQQVIVDTSNSRYNAGKLQEQAEKLGIRLHNIHTQGAFLQDFE